MNNEFCNKIYKVNIPMITKKKNQRLIKDLVNVRYFTERQASGRKFDAQTQTSRIVVFVNLESGHAH